MIQPTVGRVVWFYPPKDQRCESSQPMAAIVTFVFSDTCVNLAIFADSGGGFLIDPPGSVPLLQDGEEAPDEAYCCWMPYQKGQAAKIEALEKKLEGC